MSINTSSNVLNQTSNVQLDRYEMDRCTKESCCSLSGFPYSRLAFRKYRHFALIKMEDLSGIFSTPGAVDGLTIQGQVQHRNNTSEDVGANTADLIMMAWYFNKKMTLNRVSSNIESVTVSKEVAAGIRNGR